MALTSISVILTVCVLKLHHCGPRQTEVPCWLRFLVLRIMATLVTCRLPPANRPRRHKRHKKGNSDNPDVCLRLVNDYTHNKHSPVAEFRNSHSKVHDSDKTYNDITTTNLSEVNHQPPVDSSPSMSPSDIRRLKVMEEILRYLKIMVAKRDDDDSQAELVNEWQQVAAVMDRFLFWLFLLATIVSTVVMMVVVPLLRDIEEYGEGAEPV